MSCIRFYAAKIVASLGGQKSPASLTAAAAVRPLVAGCRRPIARRPVPPGTTGPFAEAWLVAVSSFSRTVTYRFTFLGDPRRTVARSQWNLLGCPADSVAQYGACVCQRREGGVA
jgi:hypothetical protein